MKKFGLIVTLSLLVVTTLTGCATMRRWSGSEKSESADLGPGQTADADILEAPATGLITWAWYSPKTRVGPGVKVEDSRTKGYHLNVSEGHVRTTDELTTAIAALDDGTIVVNIVALGLSAKDRPFLADNRNGWGVSDRPSEVDFLKCTPEGICTSQREPDVRSNGFTIAAYRQ